jgi:cob(I)alamin adenosyltransferase
VADAQRIYTRTGDDGSTGLRTGERVSKSCIRLEAYGTVDELNTQLGVVLASSPAGDLVQPLRRIQGELLRAGAELAVPEAEPSKPPRPTIEQGHVIALEKLIDQLSEKLPPLDKFLLPGGSLAAAQLHAARTICRRAERLMVRLAQQEPIGPQIIPYLNRLSDSLFVMARYQNQADGVAESEWGGGA